MGGSASKKGDGADGATNDVSALSEHEVEDVEWRGSEHEGN